jgi:phosphoribosylamine-glycine ligase
MYKGSIFDGILYLYILVIKMEKNDDIIKINQAIADAEIQVKMSGFLQRLNEYHNKIGLSNASGASNLIDITTLNENIRGGKE